MEHQLYASIDEMLAPEALSELDGQPVTVARCLPLHSDDSKSGSHFLAVETNGGQGRRYILKRISMEWDWIMRATDDQACRERLIDDTMLPPSIRAPLLGHAPDGDGYALLMLDITSELLPPGSIETQLELIVSGMVELHAAPVPADVPWCDLSARLTLLTPRIAEIAAGYGAPVARDIIEGWRLVDLHAPRRTAALIREISREPAPLLRALWDLPSAFLHGDLKFDNIGFDANHRTWLIDWAMTLVAPPAVELGWFLAINSRRMTLPLDEVMALYAHHAAIDGRHRERHDALTVICGLLLRGWRKALDAESGEPAELEWWCERAMAAERFLG
jgi:hypothetical protein